MEVPSGTRAAFLLLVALTIPLASCSGPGLPQPDDLPTAGEPMEGEESWACYGLGASRASKPVVMLRRSEWLGVVQIGGKGYAGTFEFAGLDRRWNFGPESVSVFRPSYAILISPDGMGRYYDFTTADRVKPSQFFRCRLSR